MPDSLNTKAPNSNTLLDIRDLKTWFKTDDGMVRAVDGVDLHIDRGETLGVVGESGCGKTVTARSVLKLIDMPPGRFEGGEILWQGRNLIPLSADEMDKIRAREIAIIFQEPMTSLNPVYTVGDQIAEVLRQQRGAEAVGQSEDMLPADGAGEQIGIDLPAGTPQLAFRREQRHQAFDVVAPNAVAVARRQIADGFTVKQGFELVFLLHATPPRRLARARRPRPDYCRWTCPATRASASFPCPNIPRSR